MRKELEIIRIIEQYLNGELNGEDKKRFEDQLAKSPELQKQVEKQKLVMEGVQQIATKQKITKAKKTYYITKATWYGIIALAVAGVVTAGVIGYQKYFSNGNTSENIKYELNEEGTTQWAEADEMIAPQYFNIDMSKGDVVQTAQGMIIAVPEGAFLDKNGNPVTGMIELEVKEALDDASIMMAGLSTKSGDDLLETGGMFYVNARKDGENLTINPNNPVVVEVPTDEVLGGMELYKGVRQADGSLDWQNPKPIEQFLTPVDIHSLDFYPPAYEPKLQDMGYASEKKDWKDSVYFSFANTYKMTNIPVIYNLEGSYQKDSIVKSDKPRELNPSKVQTIWNDQFQNTLIATKEFEERMKCLHGLAQDQFLDLYVNNLDKRMSAIDSMVVERIGGFENQEVSLVIVDTIDYSGFQGGSMTREARVADSLASLDAFAAVTTTCTPCESCDLDDLKNQFIKFALQNKGRVKMELGATQMLQAYYQKHSKIYAAVAEKVQDQFRKEYDKEKVDLGNAKSNKSMQDWMRDTQNLVKEIDDNLTETYKQLGLKRVRIPVAKYTIGLENTGWNNIDRKVIEGTVARTTINVEYEGKTAEIKYEPISIKVIDESKYDRVFVYLLPKQLTSFQRIKKAGDLFTEKLNEFYNYDAVVVGYIGEKIYIGIERKVEPKEYSISLNTTDKSDLQAVFQSVGKPKHRVEFIQDILDQQVMMQMETTVTKMEDMISFREQLERAIFRCSMTSVGVSDEDNSQVAWH